MAKITPFGQLPSGATVDQITLKGGGLTAHVLTYGAILRDLRLDGCAAPLVLGFEGLEAYYEHSGYFGATVGRCANRIAGGCFTLDGQHLQLDQNDGSNHLHGGRGGISQQVWTIKDSGASHVTLGVTSPSGEMGYPGTLTIALTIRLLAGGVLDLKMEAVTDAQTLCNLAHHSYFNLGGRDILSHHLQISADHYLPVDETLIPSGDVADVRGSAFDFRRTKLLAEACNAVSIDHNFCLSHSCHPLRRVATLSNDTITMQVNTDQPGLQIYDAARMNVLVAGLDGQIYGPYAGLAMEPQFWPDAINHPDWAQPVLQPGATYQQHTQFVFSRNAV